METIKLWGLHGEKEGPPSRFRLSSPGWRHVPASDAMRHKQDRNQDKWGRNTPNAEGERMRHAKKAAQLSPWWIPRVDRALGPCQCWPSRACRPVSAWFWNGLDPGSGPWRPLIRVEHARTRAEGDPYHDCLGSQHLNPTGARTLTGIFAFPGISVLVAGCCWLLVRRARSPQ